MAVAVEIKFPGATLEQYDQVLERMGLTPQGQGPPGAISHYVVKTDDGIRVVDVWESREVFERFAEEQIEPHTKAVGFEGEPEIQVHEVHNYLTKG